MFDGVCWPNIRIIWISKTLLFSKLFYQTFIKNKFSFEQIWIIYVVPFKQQIRTLHKIIHRVTSRNTFFISTYRTNELENHKWADNCGKNSFPVIWKKGFIFFYLRAPTGKTFVGAPAHLPKGWRYWIVGQRPCSIYCRDKYVYKLWKNLVRGLWLLEFSRLIEIFTLKVQNKILL